MAKASAKTIQLLLDSGDLKGVVMIEDSLWNNGQFYSAPRDVVDDLIKNDDCKKYGVYLLLSDDLVYVGQSSDLTRRLGEHMIGKLWWDRVVIFTTKDDSFTKADIDYLETTLMEMAKGVNRLDSDNKIKGHEKKVSKFRKVELEQYLDEALFLLELIGINVFSKEKKKTHKSGTTIETGDSKITHSLREKRAKKEVIQFLKDNGIVVSKDVTYAMRQEKRPEFWANPKVDLLDKEWDIIFNNQIDGVIHVLHVPAKSFTVDTESENNLLLRNNGLVDLNISVDSFVDRKSKQDFSPFITNTIKYN